MDNQHIHYTPKGTLPISKYFPVFLGPDFIFPTLGIILIAASHGVSLHGDGYGRIFNSIQIKVVDIVAVLLL